MSFAGIIKDYGPSVTLVVAVIGLIYNNKTSNHREKRKEFRAEIDLIEKVVKEITSSLMTYLKKPARDDEAVSLEIEIKGKFQELFFRWERLKKRQSGGDLGLYMDPCDTNVEAFFDHCTGDYFEVGKRIPGDQISAHAQKAQVHALILVESLHSLFLMKFDGIKNPNL
jgi:hypothetical protein